MKGWWLNYVTLNPLTLYLSIYYCLCMYVISKRSRWKFFLQNSTIFRSDIRVINVSINYCNSLCFFSVLNRANDSLNLVPKHPWSTLSQNPSINPSYPFGLQCQPRTFGTFSKISLNTSKSPNEKVVQFVEAHNSPAGEPPCAIGRRPPHVAHRLHAHAIAPVGHEARAKPPRSADGL
jgi:hypothetical protein